MLAMTPNLRELTSHHRLLQRPSAHAEDPLVEHAYGGNALMQRMRGEVAAIQLDLGQLRHVRKCTMRKWHALLALTSTISIAPSAPSSMHKRRSGARRC